ncbi:MAG: GHKL domain-containing protein, partial [Chitinophagales bacterium]|nr:GHKL domain-containing protein [Chitinophagales bacterium]
LGSFVTLFMVLGIVPYISIQIKAITDSFIVLWQGIEQTNKVVNSLDWANEASLYFTILLALFSLWFGTRSAQTTTQNQGMVMAIAFESIIKLVAFLTVGIYVTYWVFNGFGDIFNQTNALSITPNLLLIPNNGYFNWFVLSLLSGIAIMFLPRQFQLAVVENTNEQHLHKAIWLFPLYLFIINLFVLPIALGGKLMFGNSINPDTYLLAIAIQKSNYWIAGLAYLGGFSAATGMIIVETIALSLLLSNNLIMPIVVKSNWVADKHLSRISLFSRRFSIAALLFLAYLYYQNVANHYSLVSIGLISFAAVAQLAPATLGGIFWKNSTRAGAFAGLLAGFITWAFTLVVPTLISAKLLPNAWLSVGLGNISLFNPNALWGVTGIDSLEQAVFWSLFFNVFMYVGVSLFSRQSSKEHNQAELFVDIFKYSEIYESSVVWKGSAYIPDIKTLLINFLGANKTNELLQQYAERYDVTWNNKDQADSRLVTFAETQLAGIIGSTSARIVVSSIIKEDTISIDEVVEILKESQQLLSINKELATKTTELRQVTEQLKYINEQLKQKDVQKDEFLYTVTHELRTPLTSIRALSEILYDYDDIDTTEKRHFLSTIIKESERMTRLITQVLDLEKLESGEQKLNLSEVEIIDLIEESVTAVKQLATEKGVALFIDIAPFMPIFTADKDRLMQVIINLLSNAIKFCPSEQGVIKIQAQIINNNLQISVADNGLGIPLVYKNRIFDKFYQAQMLNKSKPHGSGLGLAISKKIIDLHHGLIWVENNEQEGATFFVQIPLV